MIAWNPIAVWNTHVQRRARAAVVRDEAFRHADAAEELVGTLNRQLRAIERHGYGTQARLLAQLEAEKTREAWLYHHHMAGGDVEAAEAHRAEALQISAMLARVPVREAAHA